ncbi:MAG: (Fe-S)-binding protein, partial [Fimbriimonadales bacterium]|nr:(Fe-S)-binding protein [Fimbriimonadales bacterium]
ACPTFVETGQEAESPRGRIYLMRAVVDSRQHWKQVAPHLDACMGCLGCQTACPSGVPYARLIEAAREQVERHARSPLQRWFRQQAIRSFTTPWRLRGLLRVARRLRLRRAPRWFARLLGAPESVVWLPRSEPSDLSNLPGRIPAQGEQRGRVGLLLGCVMRVLFPQVHRATVEVLTRCGLEVVIPRRQGCCGALWVHNGYPQHAKALARRLFKAFEDVDYIVVNAAGCGSTMKEYPLLFEGAREEAQARDFSRRVRDVNELLAEIGIPQPLRPVPMRLTCHDACHLVHGQGIQEQPRQLLRQIPGVELHEMEGADMCCGSAGIYNLLQPKLASAALKRKVEAILATGAGAIISANPGCTLWIAQGLVEAGSRLPLYHPVEILARACTLSDPSEP